MYPLHEAAREGDLEKARALLEINPELVSSQDEHGETPLHKAALTGRKDVAQLLLASGASANAKDNDGNTPLHYAALQGNKEVAELLLASGADVNARNNDEAWLIYRPRASFSTPLHLAAAAGHKDLAELLLAHHAEVNLRDDFGYTPLQCAKAGARSNLAVIEVMYFEGCRAVVELLRQRGGQE